MDRLELQRRPARDATREYALLLTQRAAEACVRLHDPADVEALHDFRVGVRRLRTFLTAYRATLDAGPKALAGLKRLAKSTNEPRDLEVGLVWTRREREGVPARQRSGVDRWIERMHEQTLAAYAAVRASVPSGWAAVESRLRRRFSFAAELMPAAESFGQISAVLVRSCADGLESGLAGIASIEDVEPAHDARIRAKRLRYLIEPFRGAVPRAKSVVRTLRELQDLLGDLNDVHVILPRLRDAACSAAADRARRLFEAGLDPASGGAALRAARVRDGSAGLLALARIAVERRQALFSTARERFLAGKADSLLVDVRSVADALAASRRAPLRLVQSPEIAPAEGE